VRAYFRRAVVARRVLVDHVRSGRWPTAAPATPVAEAAAPSSAMPAPQSGFEPGACGELRRRRG
jgi:hypothetical protein